MIHLVLLIVKFTLLESHLFGHLFANTGLSEIGGPKFIVDKHLFSSIQIAVNVCVCSHVKGAVANATWMIIPLTIWIYLTNKHNDSICNLIYIYYIYIYTYIYTWVCLKISYPKIHCLIIIIPIKMVSLGVYGGIRHTPLSSSPSCNSAVDGLYTGISSHLWASQSRSEELGTKLFHGSLRGQRSQPEVSRYVTSLS